MNALQEVSGGHALASFEPQRMRDINAQTDGVITWARQLKQWDALEKAVDYKIEQQIEFVRWWEENVTINHGAGRGKKNSDPGSFSVDQAEEVTGISQQQVSKWRKRTAPEKVAAYRDLLYGAAYRKAMGEGADVANHRAQGTGENEWYTPAEYVEAARDVMGGIDLDPASSPVAQRTVKAAKFFTAKDDGLSKEWQGRVWLNPPYAQPAIAHFIDKLVSELPRISEAVLLTHNYTDTAWFHAAAFPAAAICFTRGRIGFISPQGERACPTQGQAFFYFGERSAAFAERFSQFGFIALPT